MKRKCVTPIALLFAAITATAAPITRKQAAENVHNFLYGQTAQLYAGSQLKLATSDGENQPYYIFNIGDEEGFVIASGDDATHTILGYSFEGHIDTNHLPDNLRAWLEGYARDLEYLQQQNLPARVATVAATSRRNIPAMIETQWAQDFPYNKFCPDFNDGYGNRPTGCVATAIAQVMNFHQWPEAATGKVAAYQFDDTYSGGDGKTKQVEGLDPTTFDWDGMLNSYNADSNRRSADAVANLMNYVGRSVKMVYGPYSSGAFATDIIPAMTGVFGYKGGAKLEYREYFSSDTWDDMIYNELANNRPVVYFGATRTRMGHQFVCDGYEDGFFHINWGWAGTSDGFFKLSVLNPDEQGTGGAGNGASFSEYQNAIFGLEKPVTTDRIYAMGSMTTKDENIRINVKFDNASGRFVSGAFDVVLPEGITLEEGEDGTPAVSFCPLRSAKADHQVSVTKTEGNTYRISFSSPSQSAIQVSSGPLVRLNLKASAQLAEESYTAYIRNVVLKNKSQAETSLSDTSFAINFYEVAVPLTGDANKDGSVTPEDVACVVKYIMYKFPSPFDFTLADVNHDGVLDIADVLLIQDMVLEASGADRNIVATEIDETDELSLSLANQQFTLNLTHTTGYKAIQLDLILPADITLQDVTPDSERMEGFITTFTPISQGRYRMLAYSPQGMNIALQKGALLHFITDVLPQQEVAVNSIVLVTSDLKRTTLRNFSDVPSGIDRISTDDEEMVIYNLNGVRVEGQLNQLPKGIYIVNGKKRAVR